MPKCYYDDPDICTDELWKCETCGQYYCSEHWHETDKGYKVECVACEYGRLHPNEED
jgi:hypothetical protein